MALMPDPGLPRPPAPAGQATGSSSARPFANLVLIGGIGVLFSAWILNFTAWFPAVGGLLALGGLFSWLAFISQILTKSRTEALQMEVDRHVFDNRWATWVALLILIAGAAVSAAVGSVELQSYRDVNTLVSRYDPVDAKTADTARLGGRETVRWPVFSGWAGRRLFRAKIQGLPDRICEVRPREKLILHVPDSFFRPVVLLKPTHSFMTTIMQNPAELIVEYQGVPRRIPQYTGQSVWIGCDRDVDVPARLQDEWRSELRVSQAENLVGSWLYPLALPGERFELVPGETLRVRIATEDNRTLVATSIVVRRLSDAADFPQVEVLGVAQ